MAPQDVQDGSRPREIAYGAATSLLRGHAFAALDNPGRALRCYKAALLADPRCYEAFRVSQLNARGEGGSSGQAHSKAVLLDASLSSHNGAASIVLMQLSP